jgi:hypothetical protein
MARLSAEEQKEYEEEVEYQQEHQPSSTRYRKPSAMERIKEAVKGAAQKAQEVNNGPTGKAIRSFAEKVNKSEGLGSSRQGSHQAPQSARAMRQQPQTQVNPGSVMHPRVSIIVQGKLVGPARGQQNPQARQKSRRRGGGGDSGLSGDQFFSNDRGL